MKAAGVFLALSLGLLAGCNSITRIGGATVEIRGVVRDRDDRSPVPNLPVIVKGSHVKVSSWLTLWPIASFTPLLEVTTDTNGRFSCSVPHYGAYRFSAGDLARTQWGDHYVERAKISTASEVEILVGPPIFLPTPAKFEPMLERTAPVPSGATSERIARP